MKLEKVTMKTRGLVLEEIEDANKPTKVEPENLEPVLNDEQKALAKREEEIKKIIAKRLEKNKKAAEETKGEDHAILSKDIKVKEEFCKNRKEVGALAESLKEKGIKFFVKKINEGENRYKVIYNPLTETPLKESDCDNIDIEALEWYVKNYSEGDNITVTADLLNVLEQSLAMYKKHCGEVKEDVNAEANIQRADDYWANEVLYQIEAIEDLSKDERILKASDEELKELAKRVAEKILNDDQVWGEINDAIEWYIYHDEYMLANRKDESLNESDLKEEEIISKEQLKKIVDRYDLEDIMKGDLDAQDTDINEIILDCMDEVNKDGIEPYTSEWDELYAKVEPLVYQEIRSRGYKTESTSCSKKGARKLKEDSETSKEPINKKIENPRKEPIKEENHKGPFEIEYWVDEEARDMGFGDIYLERFDDLEEAIEVADSLFKEVASVEVLDANGQVVYGRYPEDESCSKKTIKEENECARVEYCVMDELDNNIECFDNSEDAINFALENEGVRVLEVCYGPEDEYGDEPELSCEEVWSIREDLKEEDKPAPKSIEDCQKWVDYDMEHYGKISKNTNDIIKKAGFQILKDDHGDYEVAAGHYEDLEKKEKKFAKKVVQPGVQFDDDDIGANVQFNEAEAHALIGDKPIIEEGKTEADIANDFSTQYISNDALKSLEDDDNI